MKWNLFSFFLTSQELEIQENSFVEFNSNLLETNLFNILLLLGILFYVIQNSLRQNLEKRQENIIQVIENAQNDLLLASKAYTDAENGFSQSLIWLQIWKTMYQHEQKQFVTSKYTQIALGLKETFVTTEILLDNFEKKTFLSIKKYILLSTTSRIIRKYIQLPKERKTGVFRALIKKYEAGDIVLTKGGKEQ